MKSTWSLRSNSLNFTMLWVAHSLFKKSSYSIWKYLYWVLGIWGLSVELRQLSLRPNKRSGIVAFTCILSRLLYFQVSARGQVFTAGTQVASSSLWLTPMVSWFPEVCLTVYCVLPDGEVISDTLLVPIQQPNHVTASFTLAPPLLCRILLFTLCSSSSSVSSSFMKSPPLYHVLLFFISLLLIYEDSSSLPSAPLLYQSPPL
jgi:hypothetical protein